MKVFWNAVLVVAIVAVIGILVWSARSGGAPPQVAGPVNQTPIPAPLPVGDGHDHEHDPAELAAIERLDPLQLRRAMEAGDAVVIDVRPAEAYVDGHIPGALHIPEHYIAGQMTWLPKEKLIVAYCT
jgi:hypothetical protein